jgi:para-nitrobenzyl esterase
MILTACPMARGLFQRAIVESGGSSVGKCHAAGPQTMAEAEAQGQEFAKAKGAKSLADLRALSWEKLLEPLPNDTRAAACPGCFSHLFPTAIFAGSVYRRSHRTGKTERCGDADRRQQGRTRRLWTPQGSVTAESFAKQARQRYGEAAAEFLKLYPAQHG